MCRHLFNENLKKFKLLFIESEGIITNLKISFEIKSRKIIEAP